MSKNTVKNRNCKQTIQNQANTKKRTPQPENSAKTGTQNITKPRTKRIIKQINNVNQEYYPNKMKRSKPVNKVVMKAKCHLKVIGGLRKRKKNTPIKGSISTANSDTEWEPHEAIQEAEQAWDSDEDLLEILTCPSPVWWEDPPDEGYSEEPILIRTQQEFDRESHCVTKTAETINMKINKTDKKFIEKRSKLENILGNIKNKIIDRDATPEDEPITFNDSLADDLENIKIPIATKNYVPSSMPPLKRRPAKTSQQDSISDRDVTFLDDSETSAVKNDRRHEKKAESAEDFSDGLVTVYKIMNETEKTGKINDYYKKRKNTKVRKRKASVLKKCWQCNLDIKNIKLNSKCMICKHYISDSCKCSWFGARLCRCKMTFAYKCKLCNFDTLFVEVIQKHLESHNCKKSISKYWKRFCFAVKR